MLANKFDLIDMAVLITVLQPSTEHQLTLQDHPDNASVLEGVSVYLIVLTQYLSPSHEWSKIHIRVCRPHVWLYRYSSLVNRSAVCHQIWDEYRTTVNNGISSRTQPKQLAVHFTCFMTAQCVNCWRVWASHPVYNSWQHRSCSVYNSCGLMPSWTGSCISVCTYFVFFFLNPVLVFKVLRLSLKPG